MTAPAAMPGEEDVARALCKDQHYDPDFDYDPHGIYDRPGCNVRWKLYQGQARAVLDIFAPILAEKERGIAYWLYYHDQGQEEIRQLSDDLTFAEHELNELRGAAREVLEHRVGDLPTAGYLRDNDASRKALAALAQIAAPGAAMEAQDGR